LKILDAAPEGEFLFPGERGTKPVGRTAISDLCEHLGYKGKLTRHGFRTTLRVWGSEQTNHSPEVLEMALAHSVGTAVERVYNRTDMLERRKAVMNDWAAFCNSAA
jgi:integrase